MTNLEAIKADVVHPLPDNSFKKVLLDRGLSDSDQYDPNNVKPFELAKADALLIVVASPNISEGGYTLSVSDKKELKSTASGLYRKHGITDPNRAVVSSISPW